MFVKFIRQILANVLELMNSKDRFKVQEKTKRVVVLCSRPLQNVKFGTVQRRQRNVYKSVMNVQSSYFFPI